VLEYHIEIEVSTTFFQKNRNFLEIFPKTRILPLVFAVLGLFYPFLMAKKIKKDILFIVKNIKVL